MTKLIQQKDGYGCGIACLAMIAGKTYDEVAVDFPRINETFGMTFHDADAWLVDHGFALTRKWMFKRGNVKVTPWPPHPWAKTHLVTVVRDAASHFVVLLEDGTVLDPVSGETTTLKNIVYTEISLICGVHPIL